MKKRILSTFLVLCMALTLLPATAEAVTSDISLNIANGSVTVTNGSSYFLIAQGQQEPQPLPYSGTLTIFGTAGAQDSPSGNNLTVNIPDQTLKLVVEDLQLIANKNCIEIQAGSVNMTLEGQSAIKSHEMNKAALRIDENAALTVTQASTGSIDVRFTDTSSWTSWSAAIGGNNGGRMGSLTVAGGTVIADCPGGTGIGNGNGSGSTAAGSVTVTGGKVRASSWSASGLGGRNRHAAPLASLTISGGTVSAASGTEPAMAVTPDTSGYVEPHLTVGWTDGVPAACSVAEHGSYKGITITDRWSEAADTSWYDTAVNTFTLTTPYQLAGMAALAARSSDPVSFSGKTVTLGADISLSGAKWTPIKTFNYATFDGGGHTISGMDTREASVYSGTGYAGLFAVLKGNSAVVKNLALSGEIDIGASCGVNVGALTGKAENNVHIENVHTDVEITVEANGNRANIGGLAGNFQNNPKTILNCSAAGNITLTGGGGSNYSCVGGLSGMMIGSTLFNSYYNGDISAQAVKLNLGRLAGYSGDSDIDNCYAAGSLTGSGTTDLWKGSLIGSLSGGSAANSHHPSGESPFGHSANAAAISSVVGFNPATDAETLLAALNENVADHYLPWQIVTEENDGLPVFLQPSYWRDYKEEITDGDGSKDSPYEISSGGQLAKLADMSLTGKYIKLGANIDLSAHYWTPIALAGASTEAEPAPEYDFVHFDGSGHTISGMKVPECVPGGDDFDAAGLFGFVKYAHIKDLTLEEPTVRGVAVTNGNIRVGALAGYTSYARIENCLVSYPGGSNVPHIKAAGGGDGATTCLGGLIGMADDMSMITNCTVDYNIVRYTHINGSTAAVGGAVGWLERAVLLNVASHALADAGQLNGSTGAVMLGGLAGKATSVDETTCIVNCYASRGVEAGSGFAGLAAGGLAGYLRDSAVNNYYSGDMLDFTGKTGILFGEAAYDAAVHTLSGNYYHPAADGGCVSAAVGAADPALPETAATEMTLIDGLEIDKSALLRSLNSGVPGAQALIDDHLCALDAEDPGVAAVLDIVGPLKVSYWEIRENENDGFPVFNPAWQPPIVIITPSNNAPVIIDGVSHNIGKANTVDGVTTVAVEQTQLQRQMEAASESVIIPVESPADTVAAQLVVANVEALTAKGMTLSVQHDGVSYNIPAAAIDTGAVMSELGAADSAKTPVTIKIKKLSGSAVTPEKGKLVGAPAQFTVTAVYGGKTVEIEAFSKYVQRVIDVTEAQAKRITTAVVIESGTQRHVPTEVFQQDGKWYAKINSLTNSTYAFIENEVSFTDDDGKWFEAVATEMASRGVIDGRGEGIFDGEASITRAEFAAMLVRALGLPENGDGSVFGDVSKTAWYYGAVGKAYEFGLVDGRGDGTFDPNASISRQEAMAMVHRAAVITELSGTVGTLEAFSDADSISAWALEDAKWNAGTGLIKGNDAGIICGQNNITRGETAAIILRLLQYSGLVDVRAEA